jgi:hypothetical protein
MDRFITKAGWLASILAKKGKNELDQTGGKAGEGNGTGGNGGQDFGGTNGGIQKVRFALAGG